MQRIITAAAALTAGALLSACVFAPPASVIPADADAISKMSDRALATCGAGNVKEVNAKSFTCK